MENNDKGPVLSNLRPGSGLDLFGAKIGAVLHFCEVATHRIPDLVALKGFSKQNALLDTNIHVFQKYVFDCIP